MSAEQESGLRILVIDDKAFVRITIGRILKCAGVEQVTYASNGREAVDEIKRAEPPFDVVFCDLLMPDMDGVEVVRHLAGLTRKPVFVFISGADVALLTTAIDMARARGFTVLGAVEKPVTFEVVKNLLAKFDGASHTNYQTNANLLSAEDLVEAVLRNRLISYYQPKVHAGTQAIVGFESLARLEHPLLGLVLPNQFIALAEESGIIDALTDRLFLLGLRQCALWNAAGLVTKHSINISARLLVDLTMPDRIARLAAKHGVSAEQIILEITETGVFQDTADTLDILARLHMKGFALSIDDFGTGYSSMEQLRRVPFAELKIDRAFVNGAAHNAKAKAILKSSIELGKNLGLSVVAEGVETQEDWNLLATLGVDVVQGYFVSRPMAAEDVLDWCRSWPSRE